MEGTAPLIQEGGPGVVTFRNDPQYKPLHALPLNRLPVHDHLHLVSLLVKAQVIGDLERLRQRR